MEVKTGFPLLQKQGTKLNGKGNHLYISFVLEVFSIGILSGKGFNSFRGAQQRGREGFSSSRGAQQMLMHKKIMFDRYYCIETQCDEQKSVLSVAKIPQKWHVLCVLFENAASRANTSVILTSRFYVCYHAGY